MVLTSEEFLASRAKNTEDFSHKDKPKGNTQGSIGVDQVLLHRNFLGVGWNDKRNICRHRGKEECWKWWKWLLRIE